MTLFNMYYQCKCGTRHIRTEDGNKKLTPEQIFSEYTTNKTIKWSYPK